ncbi:unannotated protein [freshwater metagenome]|uniref:Unannotated protein n=1 Tax=freshwater metagenome TaxID=449393 RepID=A0A6J6MAV4_9ZZZZ|nr:hypothetical protein [Actinomycetota bacterium]MSZ05521.1 hypothetical protein [Actinomycetota bacterium]
MRSILLVILIILICAWYLSFLATRLDRLHHRVETSWANLDGLLQRRAAIALEIARSDFADPASTLLLTSAAYQAREASVQDRSGAESALSGALALLLIDGQTHASPSEKTLFEELAALTTKIRIAISIHTDSVSSTQAVRKRVAIRLFRLAGTAPLPVTYEFETDAL